MRDLRTITKARPSPKLPLFSDGGAFTMFGPHGDQLRIIAGSGLGWDHVSVSLANRCPTWAELELVKRTFFEDDETAMQLHVPPADHVNNHEFCLHLWRPLDAEIPRPPAELVGLPGRTPQETQSLKMGTVLMTWGHYNRQQSEWSEERTELLKRYWTEGLSGSQIAAILGEGVTRCAVLGKVARLHLPKRTPQPKPKKVRSDKGQTHKYPRRRFSKSKPVENDVPRPTPIPEFEVDLEALKTPAWAPLEGTTPIPLLALDDHKCRWSVLPDNPTALFCGCHTAPGSPYCQTHKQRARGTGTIGEREAGRISKKLRLVGV